MMIVIHSGEVLVLCVQAHWNSNGRELSHH